MIHGEFVTHRTNEELGKTAQEVFIHAIQTLCGSHL